MIDNPLCLLAIEERPNSFMPIDIKSLDIGVSSASMTLEDLDHLLFVYTEAFIREKIKENNIVPEHAFASPLVILYEDENKRKRKLPLIPEDYYLQGNIREVLFDNIEDKKIINHIINKIKLLPVEEALKDGMIVLLKNGYVEEFYKIYNRLPYFVRRILFLYLRKTFCVQNKRVREKKEEVE